MQYLSIQTGWAPPPMCGPPTVFCAMKPHSQPFQGPGTQPLFRTLTITRPWGRLRESMPQPLAFQPPTSHPQPQGYLGTTGDSGRWMRLGPQSFPLAVP